MTIYNREDYKTVLPQLEKSLNSKVDKVQANVDAVDEKAEARAKEVEDSIISNVLSSLSYEKVDITVSIGATASASDSATPYTADHPSDEYKCIGMVGYDLDGTGITASTILAVLYSDESVNLVDDHIFYQMYNGGSSARTWTLHCFMIYMRRN